MQPEGCTFGLVSIEKHAKGYAFATTDLFTPMGVSHDFDVRQLAF